MSTARPLFQPEPFREPASPQGPIAPPPQRWRWFPAWAGFAALLLMAVVVISLAVALHSRRVHNYILDKARTMASDSLNTPVDLEDFGLHFFPLSLDVYGVTIHGARPYTGTPVLQLQHARVGVRIVSFLQRKWYLSDVQVDHPVVQVFVDKNGVSNIPRPKPGNSKSNTTIFDLGIRHTRLGQGEIYYNAQSTPLSADLHDVDFRATFNELLKMYSGELKYDNGRVVFGGYQPFEHNLDAQFDLTPSTFQLHRAQLTSSAAQVNLVATATNFSAPEVQAKYDIKVDGAAVAKLIHNPQVPQGLMQATGSATYRQVASQPALNTLTVDGDLNSRQLVVGTPSLGAAVDHLAAHYTLANGDVVLHDLHAGILGGELTAQGTMKQIGGNAPRSEMTASLRRISLAQANRLVPSKSQQPVNIAGELNADAKATWGKTFDDLVAKADATVRAQAAAKHSAPAAPAGAPSTAPAELPINSELHATVHGPAKNKAALQAHITIPYLNVEYNNSIQLAAVAPIHADYRNSVLTLQRSAIKGTDTNLEFEGSVPVGSTAPMSLLLKGDVNLQLAQIFDPEIRTSGDVRFNIDSRGTSANDIGGEIDIVNASYASADMPVGMSNGNGVLKLTTDRIKIQRFAGTAGGGEVTASGGIAYRPALRFDLGLAARNIRLLYPQGMRESINADLHLAGTTEDAVLGGTVDLANVSFSPGFDVTSFAGQFSSDVAPQPSVGGIAQNMHLNLAVRSSNNVSLVSRTLSINGSANLQVRGTADNPVILGRVNLAGGDIILNGDRFVLDGGTIQFVNPSETQPVVNISMNTTIQQYNIGMRFQGPTDQMRTQYTSDPSLPEADIIHLLAFGETTEAAANAPSATPNQMAESLVANQVSSQITSRVAKVAGISQLSISPVMGNASNQQNGANITIQQRVTGNLFVTFSTNTAEATQTIQGQCKVSPKVSLSATRDPNGGFAVDTLIKKEF